MSFELQTGPYLLNQFNLCTSNLPSWLNDKTKAIYLPSLEENIQKFGKINTGGEGTPLFKLYGDVEVERAFDRALVLNRVLKWRQLSYAG